MSLALRLGRTLEELGDTMSAYEFSLWLEFYTEYPWDGEWLRTGLVCSTIANYAGKERVESAPAAMPFDYMPPWERDGAEQSTPEAEPDPLLFFQRQAEIMEIHYAASVH